MSSELTGWAQQWSRSRIRTFVAAGALVAQILLVLGYYFLAAHRHEGSLLLAGVGVVGLIYWFTMITMTRGRGKA